MRAVGFATTTVFLFCLALLTPTTLQGQRVAGIGDDAIPIPKGGFRFRVGGTWNRTADVFREVNGKLERRPLLDALDVDNLGSRLLPQLGVTEQAIGTLIGESGYALSLGPLEARGEVHESITPMSIDYGITSRLSVGIVVPYVEARTTTRFLLNPNGTGANVGENPAYLATGTAARNTNGMLLRELSTAQQVLAAEITRCALPGETGCDAILANPQGVQALLARAAQVEGAVSIVYGDSIRGGSFVAPIAGSQTQATVAAIIASLRSDFEAFGVDAIGESSAPAGATTVLGPAGFSRIFGDTGLGLGYTSLGNVRRAGIGDIDLTGTFLLFDSFGASQAARLAPTGTNLRTSITAGWRFGSGNARRTTDPFDRSTGEGTGALLLRSTTDVVVGQRFWLSATVRAVRPVADRMITTIPVEADSTILHPITVRTVDRALGTRLQLEVAPRVSLGEFFGLSGMYQLRRSGEDVYNIEATGIVATPQMVVSARALHSVAFGITYSSLASYARRRSRLPVEIIYTHSEPIAASGVLVPAVATDRLELRVYTGFPRR